MTSSASDIHDAVRTRYAAIARSTPTSAAPAPAPSEPSAAPSCCAPSCCTPEATPDVASHARAIGYSEADLEAAPEGANLGLGCGNPGAIAALQPGETVLDLGSGAGFDAFLAARRVGPEGQVIGVDMTPEMLARARRAAVEDGLAERCEFRRGHIEQLPVIDGSVDVVISNCVINLAADKPAVFREAFRVLRPGGRLAVSDIVLSRALPAGLELDEDLYAACLSGALVEDAYLEAIRAAGFVDLEVERTPAGALLESGADPMLSQATQRYGGALVREVAGTVFSAKISARRP